MLTVKKVEKDLHWVVNPSEYYQIGETKYRLEYSLDNVGLVFSREHNKCCLIDMVRNEVIMTYEVEDGLIKSREIIGNCWIFNAVKDDGSKNSCLFNIDFKDRRPIISDNIEVLSCGFFPSRNQTDYFILTNGEYKSLYFRREGKAVNSIEGYRIIDISYPGRKEIASDGFENNLLLITVKKYNNMRRQYLCKIRQSREAEEKITITPGEPLYANFLETIMDGEEIKILNNTTPTPTYSIKNGDRQEVKTSNGDLLFEYECDEILPLSNDSESTSFFKFKKNGKWGVLCYNKITSKVEEILEAQYDSYYQIGDKYIVFIKGSKSTLYTMRPEFKEIITIEDAKFFQENTDSNLIVYEQTVSESKERKYGIIQVEYSPDVNEFGTPRISYSVKIKDSGLTFIEKSPICIDNVWRKCYFYIVTCKNGKKKIVGNPTMIEALKNASGIEEYDNIEIRGSLLLAYNKSNNSSNADEYVYVYNLNNSQKKVETMLSSSPGDSSKINDTISPKVNFKFAHNHAKEPPIFGILPLKNVLCRKRRYRSRNT